MCIDVLGTKPIAIYFDNVVLAMHGLLVDDGAINYPRCLRELHTIHTYFLLRNDCATRRRSKAKSTRACWWLRNSSSSSDVDGAQADCRFRYVKISHSVYGVNLMA